jgi:hypothetical protein
VTGVEPSPLLLRPFIGLLYQLWMIDGDDEDFYSSFLLQTEHNPGPSYGRMDEVN